MGRVVEKSRPRYIRIKIHDSDYAHLKKAIDLLHKDCVIVKGINGIACYMFSEFGFHELTLNNWAFDVLECKGLIEYDKQDDVWKLTKDHFRIEYIIKQ